MMLSRFDYTPQGIATSFFKFGAAQPIKEIHDFLTGEWGKTLCHPFNLQDTI